LSIINAKNHSHHPYNYQLLTTVIIINHRYRQSLSASIMGSMVRQWVPIHLHGQLSYDHRVSIEQ